MGVFEKHLAAIEAGAVEKTNVIGMRKGLNAYWRECRGWSNSATSPKLTSWEAMALQDAVREHKPTVLGELHASGLKVLQNPRYAKRWTGHVKDVIDSLAKGPVMFRLVDWTYEGSHGQYAYPVYMVSTWAGSFSFRNIPWQSGGNGPEVLEW